MGPTSLPSWQYALSFLTCCKCCLLSLLHPVIYLYSGLSSTVNMRDIAVVVVVVASKCEKVWHKGLNLPKLPGQHHLLESGLSPPSTSGSPPQMQILLQFTWSTRSVGKKFCYHTGLHYRWYLNLHLQKASLTACYPLRAQLFFPNSGLMFLLECHLLNFF